MGVLCPLRVSTELGTGIAVVMDVFYDFFSMDLSGMNPSHIFTVVWKPPPTTRPARTVRAAINPRRILAYF